MPHGIEYIVRPFQSPGSLGNIVIPATPKETQEKAHIVWGGKGTMPAVRLINPGTEVRTCQENNTENDRDSDTVRIVGNDGESYVDVARPRRVRLTKDELINDGSLATTSSQGAKLDPQLDPYKNNFSTPADAGWKSGWKSGWGKCQVTWNLANV